MHTHREAFLVAYRAGDARVTRHFDDYYPMLCNDIGISVTAGHGREVVRLGYIHK